MTAHAPASAPPVAQLHLSRNHDCDLILVNGDHVTQVVAKCMSPLWFAILNFATEGAAHK